MEGCGPYEANCARFSSTGSAGLGVPVVEEFGFGHCEGALTLPLGVAAELDAEAAL